MLREAWKAEPTGRKVLWITAAGFVLLLIIATIVSLTVFLNPGGKKESAGSGEGSKQSEGTSSGKGAESSPVPDGAAGGEFELELDGDGMAVMPVTTDPAVAAAGAAAVLTNVQFEALTRQEFVEAAAQRMTHPSPDYVGGDGEVFGVYGTGGLDNPVPKGEWQYFEAETVLLDYAKRCGLKDPGDECRGWPLAAPGTFEGFRSQGAFASQGTPLMVMSEAEMLEWSPSTVPEESEISDFTPDTPGATFSTWWVVSEVADVWDERDKTHSSMQVGVGFGIWCDPPEAGGLCGVTAMLIDDLPTTWPLRSS